MEEDLDYRPQSHKDPSKCEFVAQPRSWAIKVWNSYQTWDHRKCSKSVRLGNRNFHFYIESPTSMSVYLLSDDGAWIARFSDHWAWRVGRIETYSCHKVKNHWTDCGTRSSRGVRGLHINGHKHPYILGIGKREYYR